MMIVTVMMTTIRRSLWLTDTDIDGGVIDVDGGTSYDVVSDVDLCVDSKGYRDVSDTSRGAHPS